MLSVAVMGEPSDSDKMLSISDLRGIFCVIMASEKFTILTSKINKNKHPLKQNF